MALVAFEDYHGFLVGGNESEKGVIVIQEWWGLNDQIKSTATKFSERGFLALAPDLYHGKIAATADEARHLMSQLDWEGALKMVGAAARLLKSKGVKKVGITGYCMGGAVVLAAAARTPEIDAAAPYYGIPPESFADLTQIKVPLQLHFGEKDDQEGFSTPSEVAKLQKKLDEAGIKYELHWYKTGHAFMNQNRPEAYHKESADLSFERVVTLFNSL